MHSPALVLVFGPSPMLEYSTEGQLPLEEHGLWFLGEWAIAIAIAIALKKKSRQSATEIGCTAAVGGLPGWCFLFSV